MDQVSHEAAILPFIVELKLTFQYRKVVDTVLQTTVERNLKGKDQSENS